MKRDISSSIIPIDSIQKLVKRQFQDLKKGSYSTEKYLVLAEKSPFEINTVKPLFPENRFSVKKIIGDWSVIAFNDVLSHNICIYNGMFSCRFVMQPNKEEIWFQNQSMHHEQILVRLRIRIWLICFFLVLTIYSIVGYLCPDMSLSIRNHWNIAFHKFYWTQCFPVLWYLWFWISHKFCCWYIWTSSLTYYVGVLNLLTPSCE